VGSLESEGFRKWGGLTKKKKKKKKLTNSGWSTGGGKELPPNPDVLKEQRGGNLRGTRGAVSRPLSRRGGDLERSQDKKNRATASFWAHEKKKKGKPGSKRKIGRRAKTTVYL